MRASWTTPGQDANRRFGIPQAVRNMKSGLRSAEPHRPHAVCADRRAKLKMSWLGPAAVGGRGLEPLGHGW